MVRSVQVVHSNRLFERSRSGAVAEFLTGDKDCGTGNDYVVQDGQVVRGDEGRILSKEEKICAIVDAVVRKHDSSGNDA